VVVDRADGSNQGGQFPMIGGRVVTQDENPPVVDLHLEVSMRGMKPAVEYSYDFETALAKPEGERFLLTSVAGVAFDADGHDLADVLAYTT